jgi:gas vesicle protein
MTIKISGNLLYLLAGAGVGTAIGMLFAPKSGRELRKMITSKAQQSVGTISERVDEGRRLAEERTRETESSIRRAVERGKNVASIGRQRFNDSIESGRVEYELTREPDVPF